ncbi:MAG: type II toxin-antitoxin system VapB family antitoxin [Dehalococcoidia bacterium]|nr:type II toxin-antitoxin system VapB family antitoxin [Dehalococcoidia bacterium]
MATNLGLDDALIEQAKELGHHRSKKEAVTAALEEYIRLKRQMGIVALFGQIDYDEDYDPREFRRRDLKRIEWEE